MLIILKYWFWYQPQKFKAAGFCSVYMFTYVYVCVSPKETGKVHPCVSAGVWHPLHHLCWDASYIWGTELGSPHVLWAVLQFLSGTFWVLYNYVIHNNFLHNVLKICPETASSHISMSQLKVSSYTLTDRVVQWWIADSGLCLPLWAAS